MTRAKIYEELTWLFAFIACGSLIVFFVSLLCFTGSRLSWLITISSFFLAFGGRYISEKCQMKWEESKMTMQDWVEMWQAIKEGRSILIPAQLQLKGQLKDIINAFGSEQAVYDYFKKVSEAEKPELEESK